MVELRTIFDSVSEIWILTDCAGTILLCSKHVERFQSFLDRPLAPGRLIFDFIPESWQAVAKNMLASLLKSAVPSTLDVNHTTADGKEMYLEFNCVGVRPDKETVTHIFIQARDVTSQKIFEKKITILAREYQDLIENANAVIIGLDVRGYITEWNEMATHITGYSKGESYIQKLSHFLAPESKIGFSDAMQNVLNGGIVSNYELAIVAQEQREVTLLINATPKVSADNQVVGLLLIGQDITELSTYRQALEQKVMERTKALKSALESERQLVEVKDRFVSMASHEFRSPISYIHRNIAALKANIERLQPSEIAERLFKLESHAQHLLSLLEDVLTIGKSGANTVKLKANLQSVQLKDFFVRIIDEVVTNTHYTHVIKLDFPDREIAIRSDENLLRNIFVNLLTNAIKFSPGKQEILLSVLPCGELIACKIKDHGLGIEHKDISKIFEPFHRGDNVQTIKGTGLGLPIVKKAVETLGGAVEVESSPGQGTIFTVHLNLR